MISRQEIANLVHGAAENFRKQASLAEQELRHVDMSQGLCDELLDPEGWHKVLATFAGTMKLAVALTDSEGRRLGECHNPQPTWLLARAAMPKTNAGCPFCLARPPQVCSAVADALRTGSVVIVEDQAGLAHAAVPLSLGGHRLGSLIAGQVFSHYPEPLPLQRVARDLGISRQQLWQQAIQQVPVTRRTLRLYADLLMSLGQAFLGERYAAFLHRMLAQTNQRYRLFIDGVKDYALITRDRTTGCITSWNSGAESLFGYTEAEIMGQEAVCLVPPEAVHREAQQLALSEADRLGSVYREGWWIRKDGSRFLGIGMLASMGQEYGLLIRDDTEVRRTQEEMQQAQKLESIGVLAGGIAHDFNNLLTSIIGGLSYAKNSLTPDHPAYPMVEIAEQSGERAAELVAQLLAYSGQGRFFISRFDFSLLISEMLPLISASIPKNVELKLLLTSGLPWMQGDASQIRQVVMNLIINGAEAIAAEGGTVRVSTGVSEAGTDVFMEVKDSGSGMNEATKARMFDPFFTTKFTGRGLGLAAVSGIIRGHKGKMNVDSVPGQGTTFTVSFPGVPAEGLKLVDPPSVISPHGAGTILVVDDEPALTKLAGMILENAGYSVLVAKHGGEGVEIFRQNAPRIAAVLLDMAMPVMDGHTAFRLIREIQPGVPIIFTSGYTEDLARKGLDSDVVAGFLQKPYRAAELIESIQKTLEDSARQ